MMDMEEQTETKDKLTIALIRKYWPVIVKWAVRLAWLAVLVVMGVTFADSLDALKDLQEEYDFDFVEPVYNMCISTVGICVILGLPQLIRRR